MTYRPRHRHGFTLTEILIALALVSFLLVGISRIFAMTSSTISKGQGVSTALRSLKAIQQTMSNDFLGYSSTGNIDQSDDNSGISPFVVPTGSSGGAPFLIINNFRSPTFADQKAFDSASLRPLPTDTFANASLKTRSIDVNGDGVINGSSTAVAGGEVIPLYFYGQRNFRCDTVSFFGHGNFKSQTGSGSDYVDDISASDAWYWYGHLRVFNSDPTNMVQSAYYGSPGDRVTSGNQPNRNNQFASQFALGRMQGLLVEPTELAVASGTVQTVQTTSGKNVYFVGRRWNTPDDIDTGRLAGPTPHITPIYYTNATNTGNSGSFVQVFNGTANTDVSFTSDASPSTGTADRTMIYHTRTDILGTGIAPLRERTKFVQGLQPNDWWANLFVDWNERPWINPYVGSLSSGAPRSLARRVPLLAEACSQFIVEYAGDFITQNATNGAITAIVPDGIMDFAAVPNPVGGAITRQTRWYGMPRDVDGDNVIQGNTSGGPAPLAMMQSTDVVYLRDIRGAQSSFEKPTTTGNMIPAQANYHLVTADLNSQNQTRYTCVWGPTEFETPKAVTTAGKKLYDVPQMIRVIVEISDPKGRLSEPVTQEYVFPVKVSE